MKMGSRINNRGIALLIVLLVTALLIALIFEFSYATRISKNSAVNFRDSQRAYFLARSGVYLFAKYPQLQDNLPQGEWGVVPIVSGGDTLVRIKWEDETGKIKVTDVKNDKATQSMIRTLFDNKRIDLAVYDKLTDTTSEIYRLGLLAGLHQYMGDEDFNKVYESLTVSLVPTHTININTASADVLQSLGISADAVGLIIQGRQKTPYADLEKVPGIGGIQINGLNLSSYLTTTVGGYSTVYSYATVGGYTRQVEAIISKNPLKVFYWRAL
jgi:DNA uptake protein ComE-like DNA-binding protein